MFLLPIPSPRLFRRRPPGSGLTLLVPSPALFYIHWARIVLSEGARRVVKMLLVMLLIGAERVCLFIEALPSK